MRKAKQAKDPPYFKISHTIVTSPEFKALTLSSKHLFYTLCRLRNRFCKGFNHNVDMAFWRNEKELCQDTGLTPRTLRRSRSQLIQFNFVHYTRNSPPRYKICDDVYQRQEDEYRDKDALNKD